MNDAEIVGKVDPIYAEDIIRVMMYLRAAKGNLFVYSSTQKYEMCGYGVGGIEPVRTVVLRIPIQYLLMETSEAGLMQRGSARILRDRTKSYGKHHPGVEGWMDVQARRRSTRDKESRRLSFGCKVRG